MMTNKGYTTRPVVCLRTDDLLEETLQATYDTGYLADTGPSEVLTQAIDRRRECFAEIRRRLVRGPEPKA